jgi:hypothetical protein
MMRLTLTLFCILLGLASSAKVGLRLRQTKALARAKQLGKFNGESKAAGQFFSQQLVGLPVKNLTKAKVDSVVSSLQAEVEKLSTNVKSMKVLEKKDRANKGKEEKFKDGLKGKDKEMMENMDVFFSRMNRKSEASAVDVMSKLKNAIHLIKKGALSGDEKENAKLTDVLKGMSAMVR